MVLDAVVPKETIRRQWREVAARYGAAFQVIECVCSDQKTHRERLLVRQRGIPGWYELSWDDVLLVGETWEPWADERLVLEAMQPVDVNVQGMLDYLRRGVASAGA